MSTRIHVTMVALCVTAMIITMVNVSRGQYTLASGLIFSLEFFGLTQFLHAALDAARRESK